MDHVPDGVTHQLFIKINYILWEVEMIMIYKMYMNGVSKRINGEKLN
jgi:hypothetical protein